jgi:hypothetical protein
MVLAAKLQREGPESSCVACESAKRGKLQHVEASSSGSLGEGVENFLSVLSLPNPTEIGEGRGSSHVQLLPVPTD